MNRLHMTIAVFAALIAAVAMLVLAWGQQGATPADAQQAGLVELSLNVVPAANVTCTPAQNPDKCTVDPLTQFTLTVDMDAIPPGGYSVYDLQVVHPFLLSTDVRHVAPGFASSGVAGVGTDSFLAGAITSLSFPLPKSTHLGPLVEADITCRRNTFKIDLPVPVTGVKDQNNQAIPITTVLEDGVKVADTLTINCGEPVGGIAELPEVAGTPLGTDGSSGASAGLLTGVAGAVVVGTLALGSAAWYSRQRWRRG